MPVGTLPTVEPEDRLDGWRRRGDPNADTLIAELAARGEIRAVSGVLRHLVDNEQPIPDELPTSVAAWLADTASLPAWADLERTERGTRLAADHAPQVAVALAGAALPYCYASYPDVKALTFSHRLDQDHYRRVGETAQFVLGVSAAGSMRAGGKGIRKIQKVRLLHAAIRHLISHSARWDDRAWGTPINQEALVGTLLSFSVVVLRGLRALGVRVRPHEAEDYFYSWRVIGEMLGIAGDVLPRDLDEATELTSLVARRNHRRSDDGITMTRALLELMADSLPHRLDAAPAALMRYMSGDELCDLLDVPRRDWAPLRRVSPGLGRIVDFAQSAPGLSRVTNPMGTMLLNRKAVQLAGRRRSASFAIPVPLTDEADWTASGVFAAPPERDGGQTQ